MQTSGTYSTVSSILIPHITQGTNEKRVFSCNKSGKDAMGIKGNIIAWDQDIAVGRFFIATTPLANKSLCYCTLGDSAMLSTSKRDKLPQTVGLGTVKPILSLSRKPPLPTGDARVGEKGAPGMFSHWALGEETVQMPGYDAQIKLKEKKHLEGPRPQSLWPVHNMS